MLYDFGLLTTKCTWIIDQICQNATDFVNGSKKQQNQKKKQKTENKTNKQQKHKKQQHKKDR